MSMSMSLSLNNSSVGGKEIMVLYSNGSHLEQFRFHRSLVMGVGASKLSRIFLGHVSRHQKRSYSVPKGYIPVHVGVDDKMKRFMVHRTSLSDADFIELLSKSADEYGFRNPGVLTIPYDAKIFEECMLSRANWKMIMVRN
ncbi:auxin-responsive protein SAUR72-like [Magnolia sinica]|uniref:auxin-responsive protein SAUR72-like n=1 Tax=Magnolia sinica TaxID=86752 RepID=UPI002658B9AB|nr:auxin-responsive protein SAUR72-like [Magnolia sinica]